MSSTKRLVAITHKNRKNRAYYEKCFTSSDLQENGLLQEEHKSLHDRVILDQSKNESLRYYGFDEKGSHFDLSLSILSLYPQPDQESSWRLANLEFTYTDLSDDCRYFYKTKQLLDYTERRKTSATHESKNIYKIGSLSIEIVLPYSLSRIVFNGYLKKSSLSAGADQKLVSTKLTISTHPSCDKFDYQYRFDTEYLTKTIELARNASKGPVVNDGTKELLELLLEDRIDLPLMFQVHLERVDGDPNPKGSVVMWGAKVKRFINSGELIQRPWNKSEPMDDLFIWSQVGHQVHLSRPLNHKRLVNGFVQSGMDYASCLTECKLKRCFTKSITDLEQQQVEAEEEDLDMEQLESFANLAVGMKIHLVAFKSKEYDIEIISNKKGLIKLDVNGYEGWAICGAYDAVRALKKAQSTLWALNIHDRKLALPLASESLLGGKGNSLIDLNRLIGGEILFYIENRPPSVGVSVPRGVVVSCVAYDMWHKSNHLIEKSIQELDNTRRALLARSVCTNPLSDKYMPLAQSQQILREQCKKTCLVLNSCPLPQVLVKQLRILLAEIFTDEDLKNPPADKNGGVNDDDDDEYKYKRFAVRSSAVGEDSLETSAAGQMRTILDARGFDSIVRSIVDCWTSQFEPEAVMYKTQNGLEFNLPMAVVVQELIPCKTAGVATTCDPLTGSKSTLQILANPGLGEGVVSGNKTDAIQLSLESLGWNEKTEEPTIGYFNQQVNGSSKDLYKVVSSDSGVDCCLAGEQILALGNLLIWLRRYSEIKDREVEWGITFEDEQQQAAPKSSSSSSSDSSANQDEHQQNNNKTTRFHIHLLQSRPLTHLFKLSSREIDHELDYGFASPINIVSRANLGEVMPGALCPLTSTYFIPIVTNQLRGEKPFEPQHTYKPYAIGSFGFHAQVACMVLTYTDTMTRFGQAGHKLDDQKNQERAAMFRAMVGTTENPNENMEARIKLTKERVNPSSKIMPSKLATLIALDSGVYSMLYFKVRRRLQGAKFQDDLTSIENYIEQLESKHPAANKGLKGDSSKASNGQTGARSTPDGSDWVLCNIRNDIRTLFARLTKGVDLLTEAWKCHIRATLLNMALNAISMKILSQQPAYPGGSLTSTEILNDFSTLMQGGGKTESGNISSLLEELIQTLIDEGKFEEARQMDTKELYQFLTTTENSTKGVKLFNEFMKKNGHRSFKEFDFSTLTWADDPSYIIKSFSTRLKFYNSEEVDKERLSAKKRAQDREEKVKEILENKVQNGRAILSGYLLPRCRNGTVRREGSKSLIIETISKYRNAFRHLGGLLCLAGRLPSADLIFMLTIEELELFVNFEGEAQVGGGADISRILYKCRRRQHRARVLNQITYPTPMLEFKEMIELTKQVTGEIPSANQQQQATAAATNAGQESSSSSGSVPQVKGLTSCAGLVTGRACVVESLEDMDQIQPNDILFTYSIDISWSVYFFTLAGIVTEVGGIVSHGAVVAREYGIPTLCTAVGACSIFKTGQTVTLDTNQGICYMASDSGEASSSSSAPIGEFEDKLQAIGNNSRRSLSQEINSVAQH